MNIIVYEKETLKVISIMKTDHAQGYFTFINAAGYAVFITDKDCVELIGENLYLVQKYIN